MTQVAASHDSHGASALPARSYKQLSGANIAFPAGTGSGMGIGFMAVGAVLAAVGAFLGYKGFGGAWATQALAAYHLSTMAVLAMCLGSLFFVMVFHLTNAGWASTIRRQFENVASFLPFAWLLIMPTLIIEIVTHGKLFLWLSPAMANDVILGKKAGYFFAPSHPDAEHGALPIFFIARAIAYGVIWTLLSRRLISLSRQQDATGDVSLSAKARLTSSWGMLIFALSTAFAGFDWLMSLDFKFFSTMWGVYFFAGAAFSAAALVAMILSIVRFKGKLEGVVTAEHFHDLGKLMFSFTVFWAYISFSQYFLIWYSNIPEETAFFNYRTEHWKGLGVFLMLGHFLVPFMLMLFRKVKQTPQLLILFALLAMVTHVCDLYWVVRPAVYAASKEPPAFLSTLPVDLLVIVGVLGIFAGYLVKRVGGSQLVATGCPYLHESMGHKNYV